nr:hypothetical protein [Proteus mirabilis]
MKQSKSPCIIIGEQVSRYQLRKQVENLLEKTNLPIFTAVSYTHITLPTKT